MDKHESDYQRGYAHGYSAALDAFSEGVMLGIPTGEILRRLNEFFNDGLMDGWRNNVAAEVQPPMAQLVKGGAE